MITAYPDLIQNSDEWHAARCGMLTASVIGKLLTPTLRVADNQTSRGLVLTLAAERITGHVDETPLSSDMWRGVEQEPEARAAYAEHHAPVTECGLIVRDEGNWRIGYSPDGLVGDDGLIEIKSRNQKVQLGTILNDQVPDENMAQIQCGLLVTGRKWCDYVSYTPGMPLWVKRVHPDQAYWNSLIDAAQQFEISVAEVLENYRAAVVDLPIPERTRELEMVI